MKLYIASSWRNTLYLTTMEYLRSQGHTILNWRENGFSWKDVSLVQTVFWLKSYYRDVILNHSRTALAFNNDFSLMKEADACVLLLPCGRSAHLKAGWFVGAGKPLHIHMPELEEPELMYKFAKSITFTLPELAAALE